jgi:hypothetical protein
MFFTLSILLLLLFNILPALVGARQASQEATMINVSGFGFLYWFFILVLFFINVKHHRNNLDLSIFSLILYLSLYFLTPFAGRIFESALIIIVITALTDFKKKYNLLFAFAIIINSVYYYTGGGSFES